MLVLTRKTHQKIIIKNKDSNPIGIITVTRIQGDKVQLGFEADTDTRFFREELLPEKELEEAKVACKTNKEALKT